MADEAGWTSHEYRATLINRISAVLWRRGPRNSGGKKGETSWIDSDNGIESMWRCHRSVISARGQSSTAASYKIANVYSAAVCQSQLNIDHYKCQTLFVTMIIQVLSNITSTSSIHMIRIPPPPGHAITGFDVVLSTNLLAEVTLYDASQLLSYLGT